MKSIFVLLALSLSFSAIARDRVQGGHVEMDNGKTVVRIEVGNDRDTDTRNLNARILRLERAVRELQNRVYDLEDDARPVTREVTIYVCTSKSNFGETSIGASALTQTEARANAIRECTKKRNPMFCEERNVTCESRVEVQRI